MRISKVSRKRKGVVTLVSTVVVCAFMLTLAAIQYRAAIRNLESQKKVQLAIDYEVREQAFLRSVVTLTPLYAANTMSENSATNNGNPRAPRRFSRMYENARDWSNLSAARSAATHAALEAAVGTALVNGNTGDTSAALNVTDFIGDVADTGVEDTGLAAGYTPSAATTRADAVGNALTGYPPQLDERVGSNDADKSVLAPLISSNLTYDLASDVDDVRSYFSDTVLYPDIHFGYGTPGVAFIARQNWWRLYLHTQALDVGNTGLGQTALNKNEYILSLYEVPAQLAISSSSFTNLGQINNTAWGANITVSGNVYAKDANVQGGANLAGLATTQGSVLAGGTVGGYNADSRAARNQFEMVNNVGQFFPISQASDFARSLFIPINTGADFFDRYAHGNPDTSSPAENINRLSRESWAEYTRGCFQCAMQLDVTETVASRTGTGTDQTPTAVELTYKTGVGTTAQEIFSVDNSNLPSAQTIGLPFYTKITGGQPVLVVDVGELADYLQNTATIPITATQLEENHSIVVNARHTIAGIEDPQDDNFGGTHMAVEMAGVKDLSLFDTHGFSFVTNYTLNILTNVNTVSTGLNGGGATYPALSIYAPSIRYGESVNARQVSLTGSIGSLSENDAATRTDILDLIAVGAATADANQIIADLRPITSLSELPPVNVMNWLVVIQKKR
ncbi:hypothetical protein ACFPK9_13590 [Rubritalea spongiae]|uniref:Type 4 fimbrial biogenesis protein PilX N-terminal domain-containing protein n=1 Tax=Rubritalea spongiae TaxID=430797 RepID=A0ABW5E062_9BACT